MDSKFRNAAFGGFNRQDVTDYLEQEAARHAKQVGELTEQLDGANERADGLAKQLDEAQERVQRLEGELARLRAEAEKTGRELAELRANADEVQRRSDRADQVEADANAYALLKQRTADVEMDARCRAQEIIDRAQTQAESIRARSAAWANDLRRRYGEARAQIDATVSHAAGELGRALQDLDRMQRHMDAQDGLLDKLGDEEK